ncbi:hypothetical protein WMY93_008795 [Mugilogobius chulae]|uniref:Uncharacterized protein n=1 Tax=Mugilogobius chulae TaxID=88201 RepID=A0AAW0PD65_9GOBI
MNLTEATGDSLRIIPAKVGRAKDSLSSSDGHLAFEGIGVVRFCELQENAQNKMQAPQMVSSLVLYPGHWDCATLPAYHPGSRRILSRNAPTCVLGDAIGEAASLSICPNVPKTTYQAVKLLYCFGIFITFALQFYVPAEILIPPLTARVDQRWKLPVDLLMRTFLVIITCERLVRLWRE